MNKIGVLRRSTGQERNSAGMAQEKAITRREAREAIVSVLFSYEYTPEKTAEELENERVRDLGSFLPGLIRVH